MQTNELCLILKLSQRNNSLTNFIYVLICINMIWYQISYKGWYVIKHIEHGIPNPKDLKFRPIVVGRSFPTSRLSQLTDILLKPFLNKIKSYIKSNIDILNSIPEKIDPNTLIVTFKVTKLYSNIVYELGKQAISFWIDKYPNRLHPRFNKKIFMV